MNVSGIGKRITNLREQKDWSQRELARRVNLNASVMNRIESEERPVKDYELDKIASVLGTTTDYLLGRTDVKEPFDPLDEIRKITDELGIEDLFFYDIEQWKNFTKEDVEDLRKHFEFIAHKAKMRKKE